MLNRIYHLGYAVEDIEAASRFYEENFGAVPGEPEVAVVAAHADRCGSRGRWRQSS